MLYKIKTTYINRIYENLTDMDPNMIELGILFIQTLNLCYP